MDGAKQALDEPGPIWGRGRRHARSRSVTRVRPRLIRTGMRWPWRRHSDPRRATGSRRQFSRPTLTCTTPCRADSSAISMVCRSRRAMDHDRPFRRPRSIGGQASTPSRSAGLRTPRRNARHPARERSSRSCRGRRLRCQDRRMMAALAHDLRLDSTDITASGRTRGLRAWRPHRARPPWWTSRLPRRGRRGRGSRQPC